MTKYKTALIRIGRIAATLYRVGKPKDTLVIYGIGAPRAPDIGQAMEADTILKYDTDLLIPDYIGYARSDGKFTPMNCIRTFLQLYNALTRGCTGTNYHEHLKIRLKYKRVIIIGRSLGGIYVPLLPRFDRRIKELAIFSPAVETSLCGGIKGEETIEDFLGGMRYDGYGYLYRGILDKRLNKLWKVHLENRDDLAPMDNIRYLKGARLFIAHGKRDKNIHFSRTVKYYDKIVKTFGDKKGSSVILKLYPKGDHMITTARPASRDFLDWIAVKRLKG